MRSPPFSRALFVCVLAVLSVLPAGCDRTVTVDAQPAGAEKLALRGESGREGTLLRPIKYGVTTYPEGTKVRVLETWLLRKDKKAKPPGYRIGGLYDATQQNDGLMLPRHAVDTYYLTTVVPELREKVVVPARWFEGAP